MMNRWLSVMLLFGLAIAATAQDKQRLGTNKTSVNPADFSVTVHITHAFLEGVQNHLHLDAVVDGKKYQMESLDGSTMLHVGDYKARVVRDDEKKSDLFTKAYEILFPDGTHWVFTVVGESE